MNPLVSVVVPVHNTEKFLAHCIKSLLCQKLSDYEVLLINDGSTDNCKAICDRYAESDPRIRVFHKTNGGVSSARNLGLDNAKGEWVYFVDSDDELFPDCLNVLVDGIGEHVDLVIGGYEQYGSDGSLLYAIEERESKILSRKEALLALFPAHAIYYPYMGYSWMYLFRNKIIQENNLRFDTSIKIKEDTLFLTQYLCLIKGNVFFNTTPVYKYKVREDSAMGSLDVRFNPAYLTSMDAVIQMHSLIQTLPEVDKELSWAAKEEVVNRVYLIYGRMIEHNAIDKSVLSSLKKRAIREVGLLYYLRYQYHRNCRRARKLIHRFFK